MEHQHVRKRVAQLARLQIPSTGGSTPPNSSKASPVNLSTMLQAFQENISLGRLPVPEPNIFSGDPMQFPEWKNAFTALIARKNIGAADKLFYLRKYTSGAAAKMIQGAFLRSDEAAYKDAWSKLNTRFGDPFIIQRAFREKLLTGQRWKIMMPRHFETILTSSQLAMMPYHMSRVYPS